MTLSFCAGPEIETFALPRICTVGELIVIEAGVMTIELAPQVKEGATVVAISDSRVALYNPKGIDVPAAFAHKREQGTLLGLRDAEEITKINIKGVFQIWLRDGSYHEVSLKEGHEWTREGCKSCPDFAAEHADISTGGIGAFNDWTLTIVRNCIVASLQSARPTADDLALPSRAAA